ncbi:MAG: 50S ribosomal protein L3 [Acidobacteria bacterium]|nr:50S ribosomal protein L3 [Acidobacteriota bacterium]
MVTGILGRKLGMTQLFSADGQVVPVTVLKAGPCVVVQRKTAAKDGYEAAQLGLVEFVKPRRINKPESGRFQKTGIEPTRVLREVRLAEGGETKTGDRITVELFKVKQKVDVTGISKGRGFAGSVRRHHFRGGDASHGSMFHRAPGSIGASSYPSRVWKGTRMAGHLGNARCTVRNLEVVQVDPDDNLLLVEGAVPGPDGGLVMIRHARKVSKGR